MGLTALPNGITYFSFSEELRVWYEGLYSIFTPINLAIITIVTIILVGIIIFYTLYQIKHGLEQLN
jgi:hypothetical protein